MSSNALASRNISFLEMVRERGQLKDIYEARDLTEVILSIQLVNPVRCAPLLVFGQEFRKLFLELPPKS
jgi:hypothetical protein